MSEQTSRMTISFLSGGYLILSNGYFDNIVTNVIKSTLSQTLY